MFVLREWNDVAGSGWVSGCWENVAIKKKKPRESFGEIPWHSKRWQASMVGYPWWDARAVAASAQRVTANYSRGKQKLVNERDTRKNSSADTHSRYSFFVRLNLIHYVLVHGPQRQNQQHRSSIGKSLYVCYVYIRKFTFVVSATSSGPLSMRSSSWLRRELRDCVPRKKKKKTTAK